MRPARQSADGYMRRARPTRHRHLNLRGEDERAALTNCTLVLSANSLKATLLVGFYLLLDDFGLLLDWHAHC